MGKRHRPAPQKVELNLTSMLDVVFQLIVFFILVSNFSASELPPLEPPTPDSSKAREPKERNRVVVNVIPEGRTGLARSVRVGVKDIAPNDYGQLTALLASSVERNPNIEVDLRADNTLHYGSVQPVMDAITAAGISRINMVAMTERATLPGG